MSSSSMRIISSSSTTRTRLAGAVGRLGMELTLSWSSDGNPHRRSTAIQPAGRGEVGGNQPAGEGEVPGIRADGAPKCLDRREF